MNNFLWVIFMQTFELILPGSEIPDWTTVRKVVGTTDYTLRKEIVIHTKTSDLPKESIKAEKVIFLCSERGDITAYPDTVRFVVTMTLDELDHFVSTRMNERNAQ